MCFVDVGPLFDDYAGDLTRPFVLGEPSSEQESLYRAAKEAQARTLGRVHDGIPARELYAASLEVFRESGLEAYFPHHAGHGLGLLGACPPFLMPNSADTLVAGDVVTVEPGVYVAGVGGCRIEDVVLVTREGYEPISSLDDPWKVAQ
jgi:Xaa-Pro aminopeptidase